MKAIPQSLPKYLWHYCHRNKLNLTGLIAVSFFWAITVTLNPYALKLLVDGMATAGSDAEELFQLLWFPAFLYVFINFSSGIVFRFSDWIMIRMFPRMKSEMISETFKCLEKHSYSYFYENFAGSLANKINDIAKGATTIINYIVEQIFTRILSMIIGAYAMYLVHPYFSTILCVWSIIFIVVSMCLSKKSQKYSKQVSSSRSNVVGRMVDSISNILNVKLFAREEDENRCIKGALNDLVVADQNLQWYLLKVKAFYSLSIALLTGCMTWLLILERSKNNITLGDSVLVLTLTTVLIRDLFVIANQLVGFSEEIGACKEALSIICTPHDLIDQPNCSVLQVTRGEIVFDRVYFAHKKGQNLFINKSITIAAGQKVGLIGLSGSGKTTFINLILRFFDVDSGIILIDGQNISNVTQESLRQQVAMIPQDHLLFHRSIRENIRYGRLEATDEMVIESAKQANCHEFIMNLKEGYDSLVGERGVKLSGGQRQRIAIARAILKNAPILILDEATSSLDSATENYIQQSLAYLMRGRTTIVIAHRLSTLFQMDRILVFNAGKIIEDGTHAQLIDLNGHYTSLWNMQVNGFINDDQISEKKRSFRDFLLAGSSYSFR